jgi:hypothetical protein
LANYPSAGMLDTLSNLVPSFIVGQNAISDPSSGSVRSGFERSRARF